ncbi:Uu.00g086710.m01.CDS01 [Anthostomella pinea]|uniref:Uu.00g086710.m01.CDS01 n=1 Tax=Anthostomella pinea TaxID=933095 RepID=A0AAI8YJX1_9PEZI|nr:Uu.00g086710.m01.CDS01 [Anthostomella pinea]
MRNSTVDDVFDNGRGCQVAIGYFGSAPITLDFDYSYAMLYVGYNDSAYLDYSLGGPSCDKNSSHQFLAISAMRKRSPGHEAQVMNTTAQFCEAAYFKRNVTVTLSASLAPDVLSIVAYGDKLPLLDTEFNRSAFEYLLGVGHPPTTERKDYPRDVTLEQYGQLVDTGIEWPLTNMVGFAVGLGNHSAGDLHDPARLGCGVFCSPQDGVFNGSLLANVLAVGVSGIFSDIPLRVSYQVSMRPTSEGIPSRGDIITVPTAARDHFQVALANISSGNRLTPWTDAAYYYLPFSTPDNWSSVDGEYYTLETGGVGVDLECSSLPSNAPSGAASVQYSVLGSTESLKISESLRASNGSIVDCYNGPASIGNISNVVDAPMAREFLNAYGDNSTRGACSTVRFIAGWARLNQPNGSNEEQTLQSIFIECRPKLQTGQFNVTVDSDGYVMQTQYLGRREQTSDSFSLEQTDHMLYEINSLFISQQATWPPWHSEVVTGDWLN